jgi:acetylxylan esterase
MSFRLRHRAPALFTLATVLLEVSPSVAASWLNNVNYGANTRMDLYVPDAPAASGPPVVVSLHYCGGNSGNAQGWLQNAADQHGFIIITPQAGGNCFDATPARSGERADIVAMVEYVVENEDADATRVFAVGASSGACMTQALLAAYPDVFAAGSSLAGVPAGAWTGGNTYGWSTAGTSGGAAWGDKVRQAHPGYSGQRPRVQLWHGQGDTTLTYSQSYPAQVAQWTNVFGVTEADATMQMIQPAGAADTWARTSYQDDTGTTVVEANSGPSNVDHDVSGRGLWGDIVRFFALDQPVSGMGGMGGNGGQPAGGFAGTGSSAGGTSGGVPGTAGTGTSGSGGRNEPIAGSGGITTVGMGSSGSSGTGGSSSGGTSAATGGAGGSSGVTPQTGGTASAGRAGSTADGGRPTAGTAGSSEETPREDGGCGCRVGSVSPGTLASGLGTLAVGALGLLARRRRR